MTPSPGRFIAGRYILEERLGEGAMGIVWRAHDQLLDRRVALKEILRDAAVDEYEMMERHERMKREAQTAARLNHPNIVTVYDVIENDGYPWIVMELVPARSLERVLASNGPLPVIRAASIGQQLLAALAAAHKAGVLHRDVKPSNVLIAPEVSVDGRRGERAVLTDFGIAQFEGDDRLTLAGTVIGSQGFIAPERMQGASATPASDLWSLGATLYTAVEGHGPHERVDVRTDSYAVVYADASPAVSAGRLGPLIGALLQRDPASRPSAREAARMFADILTPTSGEPSAPKRDGAQLSVLPAALAAPRSSSGQPTQTWPSLPAPAQQASGPQASGPQAYPTSGAGAAPDAPEHAGAFLGPFGGQAGRAPRPEGRGRGRRFALKPALITAGSAGAAVVAVAVIFFSVHAFSGTAGQTAATKSASALSSSATSAASGFPTAAPLAGPSSTVVKAINHHTGIPAGYQVHTVQPATGKAGGFSIGTPPGWAATPAMGQSTFQYALTSQTYLEIDLAQHTFGNMVAEANSLAVQDRATYPGYRRIAGSPPKPYVLSATILGAPGALWQFDYGRAQGTTMRVDVLLFTWHGQSYTITMTSLAGPSDSVWNAKTLTLMAAMLHTFRPLRA